MGIARFVRVNLVLVPLLAVGGYLFYEWLPLLVLPLGVGYITFTIIITLAYGLSKASAAIGSS
ncbi:hypothetical protein [Natronolimnohabitans innermongolicus]|uniref:Uncharacterized protein n=1 Tax=Natronolimnohabitans innermongolicus JCM 12255 TaxID=1227499 RepID=L9XGA8_9EURY|nr:hypothetical protein [Natronolimnohabitans innermongolicus]ELY60769.1 hypothetical protein C493_03667 [Natronolimnohabitans innermongolicus JCM 12255]